MVSKIFDSKIEVRVDSMNASSQGLGVSRKVSNVRIYCTGVKDGKHYIIRSEKLYKRLRVGYTYKISKLELEEVK